MEPMRWRTSRWRLLAAAAAAVAIHLLLALCIGLWPPARPAVQPRREPPISVTLQERSGSPIAPGAVAPSAPPPAAAGTRTPAGAHPPRPRSPPTPRLVGGGTGGEP